MWTEEERATIRYALNYALEGYHVGHVMENPPTIQDKLNALLQKLDTLPDAQGEWEAIEDSWFDFYWNEDADVSDDPVGARHYGYHVYQHETLGQILDLWVHGSVRAVNMTKQGFRIQRRTAPDAPALPHADAQE